MFELRRWVALAAIVAISSLIPELARAQWASDGAPVAVIGGTQNNVRIAATGSGSSVVAWDDTRPGAIGAYIQRLNTLGVARWTVNGVLLSGSGSKPQVLGDGSGGAFAVWRDSRAGALGIYAQRFDSAGTAQWTPAGGVRISTTFGEPSIDSDGAGGFVAAWQAGAQPTRNVYAQRVSPGGTTVWAA